MHQILLPILVAAFGVSAGFSQTFKAGGWTHTLNENNEATITSYSGAGGEVVIPASVGGYLVKALGGGWPPTFDSSLNSSVTSVTIPDSVTSIRAVRSLARLLERR
jgi:hypothetical protein